jgi:hypothetical protein
LNWIELNWIIIIAQQIEELYSEVLYEILHVVGCDASAEEQRAPLFSYLQEAFKLDNDTHYHLLEMARAKEVTYYIYFRLLYL